MHQNDTDDEEPRRSSSRRNSGPFSRRGSIKKETEGKISAPGSRTSTPKKTAKLSGTQNLELLVTGKQLLKKSDRANSLPITNRRQSTDSLKRRLVPKSFKTSLSQSRGTSIDDDMSLDLSQVSDFEDSLSKYGIKKVLPVATSTPKKPVKSHSLHSSIQKKEKQKLSNKSDSTVTCDSFVKTDSTSSYRQAVSTELDYSSMSPNSAASSDSAGAVQGTLVSPHTHDLQDSSTGISTFREDNSGEWGQFWANYNNSLASVPSRYYDQCPTPYRTEDIDLADLEFSTEGSRKRSPENIKTINNIIRNEGLHLTPRETQNIIKCAHILGNVLTKAIERQSKEYEYSQEKIQELYVEKPMPETEIKKKNLTLDLKETVLPLEVKEEKRWESVPTQTDISLPNTKSAPKIFESILRQLSRSSIDEAEKTIIECQEEKTEENESKETK
ncbi:dentin sialophosphoprotein-like [Danaus plexippus]|uniref:dentin sialophosphoprotein-like n=1 Tax=Danaus plexippus TaxID=13037 RepID=UPI002AB0346B|nr:dentin sialophosphoprotein-like [Danaus plexippus]